MGVPFKLLDALMVVGQRNVYRVEMVANCCVFVGFRCVCVRTGAPAVAALVTPLFDELADL